MNTKNIVVLWIVLAIIGGVIWYAALTIPKGKTGETVDQAVEMVNGQQIINVLAKGGYYPRSITATRAIPTILRISTNSTYDCSASFTIPQIGYRTFLQPTGVEEIQISADQARGTLRGVCSMGMYNFEIRFQ